MDSRPNYKYYYKFSFAGSEYKSPAHCRNTNFDGDFDFDMADVGTPSAMEMNTQKAGAEAPKAAGKSAPVARPERPDEEQYKKDLTQAEKELKASQERMVGT